MSEPDRAPDLRISDDDRHRVAEVLREAAGEGRIDLAELDLRLEATYAARTYGELVPLTADLPGQQLERHPSAVPATVAAQKHLAILSGVERKGAWEVPQEMVVRTILGGANLDLRNATFAAPEVTIRIDAILGGAEILVGPDVHVMVEGTGVLGAFTSPPGPAEAATGPGAQRVRITGVAVLGGVTVKRRSGRR